MISFQTLQLLIPHEPTWLRLASCTHGTLCLPPRYFLIVSETWAIMEYIRACLCATWNLYVWWGGSFNSSWSKPITIQMGDDRKTPLLPLPPNRLRGNSLCCFLKTAKLCLVLSVLRMVMHCHVFALSSSFSPYCDYLGKALPHTVLAHKLLLGVLCSKS